MQSADRIDLYLYTGHDPKDFVGQGDSVLHRSCLRCSAQNASSALLGETDHDSDAYTVDCYHVAAPDGDITVKLLYRRENYGRFFNILSITNGSCHALGVSTRRDKQPRLVIMFKLSSLNRDASNI